MKFNIIINKLCKSKYKTKLCKIIAFKINAIKKISKRFLIVKVNIKWSK